MNEALEITITKGADIEGYKLRCQSFYWADIFIQTFKPKRGGRLIIISDYGTWACYWSAPGDDFKAFLIKAPVDYLFDNLEIGKKPSRQITRFFEEMWPSFIEQLEAELNN